MRAAFLLKQNLTIRVGLVSTLSRWTSSPLPSRDAVNAAIASLRAFSSRGGRFLETTPRRPTSACWPIDGSRPRPLSVAPAAGGYSPSGFLRPHWRLAALPVQVAGDLMGRIHKTAFADSDPTNGKLAGFHRGLHSGAALVNRLLSGILTGVKPLWGRLPLKRMVLGKGLEPLRLSAHAPQTCVSTNSTTRA
jgi:hypothetical protein